MDEWCKRNGQIPEFGNWEFANEMPITQYFESARQAGLVRYSSSSGESDHCMRGERDLYSVDLKKPPARNTIPPSTLKKGMRNRERIYAHTAHVNVVVKDKENGNKVIMRKQLHPHDAVPRPGKPVDEDLYKIPTQLLRTTKRKKMLGFISKCLVPAAACVS